jgi:hypothetical protein
MRPVFDSGFFELYSAHELLRMLRRERWSHVELSGGLDGRPFALGSPRIVLVATK